MQPSSPPKTSAPTSSTSTTVQQPPRTSPGFEYALPSARSSAKAAAVEASQAHLGKRARGSDTNSIMGVVSAAEAGELAEEDLVKMVVRPDRKRMKTDDDYHRTDIFAQAPLAGPSLQDGIDDPSFVHSTPPPQRHTRFTVFTGPEESIPQPALEGDIFTDRDFDFFDSTTQIPPRPPGAHVPVTSTANAAENHNPFNFGYPVTGHIPMTSTPSGSGNAPVFENSPFPTTLPFPPQRPQSPSPAPSRVLRGGRIERNDRFHPFGSPPRSSSRAPSGSTTATHDSIASALSPSALLRTPPAMTLPDLVDVGPDGQAVRVGDGERRKASSNDVGAGLGMTAISEMPAVPAGRTMYGTELQADTRFGDFGVEGVASGYWINSRG